jgi:hypothetical protein
MAPMLFILFVLVIFLDRILLFYAQGLDLDSNAPVYLPHNWNYNCKLPWPCPEWVEILSCFSEWHAKIYEL